MKLAELCRIIDHTVLKPTAMPQDIRNLCKEALEYHFGAVCVHPCYVKLAKNELEGSGVKVVTVVGFPLGANTSAVKAAEAQEAIANGADELDMVLNIGAAKAGDWELVESDIRAVAQAADGVLLKVIIETCYLTDEEIVQACRTAVAGGAAFVKTSTGFGPAGAKLEHVRLMRQTVGPLIGVKASGGISTYSQALAMIEAGANRLGTSSSVKIAKEAKEASIT